ncbi:hypothetical protein [Streptomyces sp. NPDC089919]|uniref:hypothetical protein n=1 Tax=Streptomyces sp. NPDC089919 TaxID=3155188 RepID=UPI0034167E82
MYETTLALTTGSQLRDWILTAAGNLFGAFLAVRAISYFIKDDWGKMITLVIAAVFVGAMIWLPDEMRALLTGLWSKVEGSA